MSGEVPAPLRRPSERRGHPVLGQGARLVGADDLRGPERLDRAQPLDDCAAGGELAGAGGQGQGDDRQQRLRDQPDEQADGEDDRVGDRQARPNGGDGDECDRARDGNGGDQASDLANLDLERGLVGGDALREAGDPAELGVHPGGEDDGPGAPLGAGRARERQVVGIQERCAGNGSARAFDCHRFPGQSRHVDLQRALDQSRVGRNPVALPDDQEVARDEAGRLDRGPPPVPHNRRRLRQERGKRLDRAFGLDLLGEREDRVDHDHDDDRDRDRQDPRDPGEDGRRRQQQRQGMGELPHQFRQVASASPPADRVRPELHQPPLRLPLAEPVRPRAQPLEELVERALGVDALQVPGHATSHRRRGSAAGSARAASVRQIGA